jgi:hypothetical protein
LICQPACAAAYADPAGQPLFSAGLHFLQKGLKPQTNTAKHRKEGQENPELWSSGWTGMDFKTAKVLLIPSRAEKR